MSPRVVSLVPSATESLTAMGVDPVACTRFCERPELAHVGGTKDPDVAAIVALGPDLVVVDTEENRLEDHDALVAAGVEVHVLSVRSVSDVDPQLGALADVLDVRWDPVGALPDPPGDAERLAVRAAVPIWRRPWMWLGRPTYGASLLAAVGVDDVVGEAPYPELSLDEVARRRPTVVVAPDEPYPFRERHRTELEQVAPAVFVDGRDLVWWGSRTKGALTRLGDLLAGSQPQRDAGSWP